jgi:transposase
MTPRGADTDGAVDNSIEAREAAWAFYGGVFKALVPDNTKAIVDVASPTTRRIIEAFLAYAQACGFAVDPARVRRPQDKGRVERTVQFVRDDCFGGEDQGDEVSSHFTHEPPPLRLRRQLLHRPPQRSASRHRSPPVREHGARTGAVRTDRARIH